MDDRKINLLFINYSYAVGGIEILIKNLCQCLDQEKFNITLCSFSEKNDMAQEFRNMGIPIVVLKKCEGFDWFLSLKIRALCRKLNIDIVHTHNAGSWLYGALACRGKDMPVLVHTQHTVLEKEGKSKGRVNKHWLLLHCLKHLSARTARVISIAEYITRYLVDRAKVDQGKITRIYNGTDLKQFPAKISIPQKRASLGLSADAFAIGIVARLVMKKGHAVLLEAFREVKKCVPNAKLVIVGDGELMQPLEEQCQSLMIRNDVLFLGQRKDIPEILRALDVFVLSSYKDAEGLPVSILEAMASRIPVIATDSGGSREIVINGKTGLLVKPDDSVALAEAVIKIYREVDLKERIINAGLERIHSFFSLQKMVAEYEALYKSVLQREPRTWHL